MRSLCRVVKAPRFPRPDACVPSPRCCDAAAYVRHCYLFEFEFADDTSSVLSTRRRSAHTSRDKEMSAMTTKQTPIVRQLLWWEKEELRNHLLRLNRTDRRRRFAGFIGDSGVE